jgi:hypothetical protein
VSVANFAAFSISIIEDGPQTRVVIRKGVEEVWFYFHELQTLADGLKWAKGRLLVQMPRKDWHEIDPDLAQPGIPL